MPRGYAVSFDPAHLAKLQRKLGPDIVMPSVKTLLAAASRVAFDESRSRAPSFLLSTIRQDTPSDVSARVVDAHPAARAVESGRKPLIAGGKFPPPDAFLRLAHGDLKVAFAIAAAVARRGTKGRFFMNKAIAATNRQMPALAQRAADAIAQAFSKP